MLRPHYPHHFLTAQLVGRSVHGYVLDVCISDHKHLVSFMQVFHYFTHYIDDTLHIKVLVSDLDDSVLMCPA